ncbi:ATP-binding protein [Leptolyngbya sp. FACHB-17]|nr:ATP-binding protein [Leptolyngbya sp. FACHB-17]MBD2079573.1 response regulator [Leptolyngbya sp. FACHB-17]
MTPEFCSELSARIFPGKTQMAQLMRSHNWAETPLGSIEQWSSNLRTAVSICLNSRFPMVIWWGTELILLYNDAWRAVLGNRHPKALGSPGEDIFSENWHIVGPQLYSVLETGIATWADDLLIPILRSDYLEEAYYTYSYSPILSETGEVEGVFTAVAETTERVIGERRLATLRDLAAQAGKARTIAQACQATIDTLGNNLADIPFAAIYTIEAGGAVLQAQTETAPPLPIDAQSDSFWQLDTVINQRQPQWIENLAEQFEAIPVGVLATPLQQAIVLPLWASGQKVLSGLLVVGINPGRRCDNDYRNFFRMAAGHIETAIANADAYEMERKRVEALAELDRVKTEFFSNVSHEFRTPLTLMLNPLEEVLGLDSLEHRSQLETVHRNGLRLLKLVNTLLDFSRIEAGRMQATYHPIELSTFTAELASVFRTTIERGGLRFIVQCEGEDQVYVDREMWEKIVLNLISNAFKFTFEGEIEVLLRRVGESIVFSVRDTGVGIPPEALPQLFERFHRVSGTQSRSYEGSGIGLALVKELVDQHGGTISVASQVGIGTTFTVEIPLGYAHLPKEQVEDQPPQSTPVRVDAFVQEALRWTIETEIEDDGFAISESEASSCSVRILVVDDNADLRDYLKGLLTQFYSVETAIDGRDALNRIRRSAPDLILSDVMLPNLDGFGLLRELRSQPETQDIPIILLSARAGEEARVEGLGAGADDYLVKPFSARELMARVESALRLSRLRQETTDRERSLRSQAEVAQAQVETILGSIRDGFIVLDQDWRYVYNNQASLDLAGLTQDAFLGRCIWEMFPDLVGSEMYHCYHQAMRDQKVAEFEFFYPSWNCWFQHRVYPTPAGVSAFIADITEQKQTEIALRQSEERLKGALSAGRMVAWHWDAQTDEAVQSSNATEILGIAPVDLITTSQMARSLIHPEDLPNHLAVLKAAITQEDGNYVSRFRLIRPDNQEILWVEDRGTACGDASGALIRISGMVMDISDRVRLEQERERYAQQSYRILLKEQLARQEAERANRLKDEFLAVLSHELRTPLNPILGWVSLLRSGKCNPDQTQKALETIERNAKLQTQLIGDLLDVSRILQGKLNLAQEAVDLAETISAAIETVQLAADAKSLKIETRIEAVKPVIGDGGRLQQIVWNLLSNAVKFTPANGSIVVSLTEADGFARLQVCDTGRGIQSSFLPFVFDYFRQQDSSSTRSFGGLGLGLAIVRYLTELHGGIVSVYSAGEGQGATFTVKLPVVDRALDPAHPAHPIELSLQGYRVLVVDDDRDSNALATFVLQAAGASVFSASSGKEALQQLSNLQIDLLVSDIGMPEIDGYELLRQIRARSIEVPAIALTAYAGGADQKCAADAGFAAHLAKPIEPEHLLAIASTLLRKTVESAPQSLQSRMLS